MAASGVMKGSPDHHIHGSLLIYGELLRNTGEFMVPRYDEVYEKVMKYTENKDRNVRTTVIRLIPRLAKFSPDAFIRQYFKRCLDFLLRTLSSPSDRGASFLAIGKLAIAVKHVVEPELDHIITFVREGLTIKRGRAFCPEALRCISMFASALGPSVKKHIPDLLDCMFNNGLCATLVDALVEIAAHIPSLLPVIQQRLMNELSMILCLEPFHPPGSDLYNRNKILTLDSIRSLRSATSSADNQSSTGGWMS